MVKRYLKSFQAKRRKMLIVTTPEPDWGELRDLDPQWPVRIRKTGVWED
jgi:hypothetical protein